MTVLDDLQALGVAFVERFSTRMKFNPPLGWRDG
jgi:hypothetical protein